MKTLLILLTLFLIGCSPARYVDITKRHNYYQRHRNNTYTIPLWIPGRGIVLETRVYHQPKRSINKQHPRRINK